MVKITQVNITNNGVLTTKKRGRPVTKNVYIAECKLLDFQGNIIHVII